MSSAIDKMTSDLQRRLGAASDWLDVTGSRRVEVLRNTLGSKTLEFERRWGRVGWENAVAELPFYQRDVISVAIREWQAAHDEWCALHDAAADDEFTRYKDQILVTLREAGSYLSLTGLNQTIKGHQYRFTIERLRTLPGVDVRRYGAGYGIWLS